MLLVALTAASTGFHDCVQPTRRPLAHGLASAPPAGCTGGLCVGMHNGPHEGGASAYPVGNAASGYTDVRSTMTVPELPLKQDGICYYIWTDIFFGDMSQGRMNQFVPQLILGNALDSSSGPPKYAPAWHTHSTWSFGAHYFFEDLNQTSGARVGRAAYGELYEAKAGEEIFTSFVQSPQTGDDAVKGETQWTLEMGIVGDTARLSRVVVKQPYMGLGAHWPQPTTSWSELNYSNLCVNACWELYGAIDPAHFPSSGSTYHINVTRGHDSKWKWVEQWDEDEGKGKTCATSKISESHTDTVQTVEWEIGLPSEGDTWRVGDAAAVVTVDTTHAGGPLPRFFQGTGFTPSKLLLDEHGKLNMMMASGNGYKYMRVHCMLDLIDITGSHAAPVYNFTVMDASMDVIVDAGLTPFVNIDGNPTGVLHSLFMENNFLNIPKLHSWRDLMEALGRHLVQRYTAASVQTWKFEHWNEPMTIDKFCADGTLTPSFGSFQSMFNYFDACEAGLHAAHPGLQLGGPTTHSSDEVEGGNDPVGPFLAHCDSGTNAFSNKTGTRLDFISIHRKGTFHLKNDPYFGNSSNILAEERKFFTFIREKHPRFQDLPFYNDEADPISGWNHLPLWRAGPTYAAFMVAAIVQHANAMDHTSRIGGVPYGLISNDNSFMGSWLDRTLLTTFHADGCVTDKSENNCFSSPYRVIKKQDLSVMTLLSRLGLNRTSLVISGAPASARLSGVATQGVMCSTVLLTRSNNTALVDSGDAPMDVTLTFTGAGSLQTGSDLMIAHWQLDGTKGNAHGVWESAGGPVWPSDAQLQSMVAAQEPVFVPSPPLPSPSQFGATSLKLSLSLPGVALVQLCARPPSAPAAPTALAALSVQGGNATALQWKLSDAASSDVLKTFTIEGNLAGGAFSSLLAGQQMIASAWVHTHASGGVGKRCYRVSAMDYWGRTSQPSEQLCV